MSAVALSEVKYELDRTVFGPCTLTIERGQRVWIHGESGSGKSTWLRIISGSARALGSGRISGTVRLLGDDPWKWTDDERIANVAWLTQDPSTQLFTDTIYEELCVEGTISRERAKEVLSVVGLQIDLNRNPHHLSAGQQQRLMLATLVARKVGLVLLDEPLACLDPSGKLEFLQVLESLSEQGITVLLVSHQHPGAWAQRALIVKENTLHAVEVRAHKIDPLPPPRPRGPMSFATINHPFFGDMQIPIQRGMWLAVVGSNGVGKSTLLAALSRTKGAIYVPQNPDHALTGSSVSAEIPDLDLLKRLSLLPVANQSPHGLSFGQRARVAIGSALSSKPSLLLLDEPLSGLDDGAKRSLIELIRERDLCAFWVTHDLQFAQHSCHRVLALEEGSYRWLTPDQVAKVTFAPTDNCTALRVAPPLDARPHLLISGSIALLSILLERPAALVFLASIGVAVFFASPARRYSKEMVVASLAILWTSTVSQAWFFDGPVLTPLVGPLSVEGALHGLVQGLRTVIPMLFGATVFSIVGANSLLQGWRRFLLPATASWMLFIALTSIPQVASAARTTTVVLRQRGRSITLSMWVAVLAFAIRRGRQVAEGLNARGLFRKHRPVSQAKSPPILWALCGVVCSFVLVLTIARALLFAHQTGLYTNQSLHWLYVFVQVYG